MRLIRHFLIFVTLAFGVAACGYSKLAYCKVRAAFQHSPENLKTSAPEKCVLVTGMIAGAIARGTPLAIVAVTSHEKENCLMSYAIIAAPGPYYLFLPEGKYQLQVFADLNGNLLFEQNEMIGSSGNTDSLIVDKEKAEKGIVRVADIKVDPAGPRKSDAPVSLEMPEEREAALSRHVPTGLITTMDDMRFDEDNGFTGLYQPAVFFEKVNGFVYMLEEYDPAKIPIVFVHGIKGTPRDWRSVVDGLDRKRFQPWFFFYPTGLRLETIARLFHDAILANEAFRGGKTVIAAYSLGGLVVREAMNIGEGVKDENAPQLFISICSPYGGVNSAATAVSSSPVVVPSWTDLASGSEFINSLHRRNLPRGTKFNLLFAYGSSHFLKIGPNDDGTVSLKSQLDPRAQKEAGYLRGFDEKHSGILNSSELLDEFKTILASVK
ncbi:MAG TPA: hypothetical protein VMJ66_17560 [Geobacteraceae bacterium]|nr:hypothetical protein [Geobacteraceae bacterium]